MVRGLVVGTIALFDINIHATDDLVALQRTIQATNCVPDEACFDVYGAPANDGCAWSYSIQYDLIRLFEADPATVRKYATDPFSLQAFHDLPAQTLARRANMIQLLVVPAAISAALLLPTTPRQHDGALDLPPAVEAFLPSKFNCGTINHRERRVKKR